MHFNEFEVYEMCFYCILNAFQRILMCARGVLVIFQMHFKNLEVCEMCEMCFEMFFEVSEKRFVWNSLALVRKEVFHPVWALYNIKEELGHLSCARTQRPA